MSDVTEPVRHPEMVFDDAYRLTPPVSPRPIVIIGAGGIVRDAHLPAYRKAGYPVFGIVNRTVERARALADDFGVEHVFGTVAEAVAAAPPDAVYDLALMPEQYIDALQALPDGAPVLIQKPLGHTLAEGEAILEVCRRKGLVAAVNTQLRFAPYIERAREIIASGELGELYDVEVHIEVNTPWEMFPHVLTLPRLELNMHSVHYLDLLRSFLGDPDGVSATTVRHPTKTVANTRTTTILRYRDRPLRAVVSTNHDHDFGPGHEHSFVKWEGTGGALRVQLGLLLDYPVGREDAVEINTRDGRGWRSLPVEGTWFPDAFKGSMGVLMRYLEGSIPTLPTSVEDVIHTMEIVEAAHASQDTEGIAPSSLRSMT